MIEIVAPHDLTIGQLDQIERFRGEIYGNVPAVVNGRNLHALDADSYHVLLKCEGYLIGTARYTRFVGHVELGGFAVKRRGTRDVRAVINGLQELAYRFGDTKFKAHASVQNGVSQILQKLGGTVLGHYYNAAYQRDVDIIELLLETVL